MYYLIIAVIVFLDQIAKYCVTVNDATFYGVTVIPNVMRIEYMANTGAAFSILRNHPELVLTAASRMLAAMLAFMIVMRKSEPAVVLTAVALLMGGGLGNLIDRLRLGYVVDFINIEMFPAVFNIADIFVCTGSGLILLYAVLTEVKKVKRLRRLRKVRKTDEPGL
jgi:signal peptidase II